MLSMASGCRPGWAYDVFLSFRGADTRKKFTDHLHAALLLAGIATFRDDDELPRGQDISSGLLKAIQESKISIVIFSKGYASSTWCLDELAKIVECKNTNGQIVLPVFYNVDPSHVRKQTGSFAEAFECYEEYFKEVTEKEKVKNWRKALTEASNLSGWDLHSEANGHESKFIQKIVEQVLSKLNSKYLSVATHPVGIDSQVNDLIELLNVGANDVRVVGIYGMPGIGKTTMAKAVFNQLCLRFEGSCCLLNISKISQQPNGLVQLQKQLLCDTLSLKQKYYNIDSVDRGIDLIKKRFCHRRVLIILDDLDQLEQLKALALVGERDWFGLGTRIFVTVRNEHLLTQLKVYKKCQAKELNFDDSLELFSWHAFGKPHPGDEYLKFSKVIVDYVGGLPFALEILGSHLIERSIPYWKDFTRKLEEIPDPRIQRKLRTSFDALYDDKLKNMFLDIACFFIGMEQEYVAKILEGRGFYPAMGITDLIQRSLLVISDQNELTMHDLLRDMAREIIREMSPENPGNRSRLWFREDVLRVLKENLGTKDVQGLILDLDASENVGFSTESLASMRYLKLLQINTVNLTGCYEHLSKELIWLCWRKCPLESFPPSFRLSSLVVLDIQFSNIREVWNDTRSLNKLKILNLSHSKYLAKLPNFEGLSSLERLILQECTSLVEVHESIGHLERLVLLDLEGCWRLKNLPDSICCLKSLEILNINYCLSLRKLPQHVGNMEALTDLLAHSTEIKQLPSSIKNLKNLNRLLWQSAPSFTLCRANVSPISYPKSFFIPDSFPSLTSLKRIDMLGREFKISFDLGRLSLLQELDLSGRDFINLPAGVGNLPKLEELNLNSCTKLLSISKLPSSLKTLKAFGCTSMERLSVHAKTVPDLLLSGCVKLAEIHGLEIAQNKPIIYMGNCNNLVHHFKKSVLQMLSNGKLSEIVVPDTVVPDWFSHQRDASSLSFYLPASVSHSEIQGLIVWGVCSSTRRACSSRASATIRKKSTDTVLFSTSSYFPINFPSGNDQSWVTYIPFSRLQHAIDQGDELEVSVKADIVDDYNFLLSDIIADEIMIKRCGVHLILQKPDTMDAMPWTSPSSNEKRNESGPSEDGDHWHRRLTWRLMNQY